MISAEYFATTVIILLCIIMHVLFLGSLATVACRFKPQNFWIAASTVGGAGFTLLGLELFLLGYIDGWVANWLVISSGCVFALTFFFRRPIRALFLDSPAQDMAMSRGSGTRLSGRLFLSISIMVAAVLVAVLKSASDFKIVSGDEFAYHWPAPQLWASQHHWVTSPYRFTNGPSLCELLYTPSAVFNNFLSGRLTHTLMWLLLLIACLGLGTLVGCPGICVLGAVAACPAITKEAGYLLNDTGFASLVVSSFAVLLFSTPSRRSHLVLSSLIFAGALSVKWPLALVALPALLFYVLLRPGAGALSIRERILDAVIFVSPIVICLAIWFLHTYSLTGAVIDLPMSAVWNNQAPAERQHSGDGNAAPPTLIGLLMLPLIPFIGSMYGWEPLGDRLGFVIAGFLPIFLYTLRTRARSVQLNGTFMFIAASLYFMLLATISVRTRFHDFAWSLYSVLATSGFWALNTSVNTSIATKRNTRFLFGLSIFLGCAETVRALCFPEIFPLMKIVAHLLHYKGSL